MLGKLTRTAFAIYARQHAWVRSGVNYPITCRQRFEVTTLTKVSVGQMHAECSQFATVQFGARTNQIVEPKQLNTGNKILKVLCKLAAHKSADSGDQNFHVVCDKRV